ncbi:N-glycosylase/DNA lyase isoform X4 [Mastacembelus armatus]|uniref:N-glycosylase/DNA lyase isoform X4 n=1 Tax=Mastacembelus armatus TaxID=205130 RepID=UPI000E455F68|nr:N-glycosylase/DNA lyase isoform X4 [Mastacembelus armatus]
MAKHAVLKGPTIWRSLPCAKSELRLDLTLACGQSFRWRETAEGHWTGVMGGRVWTLTQTDDTLLYYIYPNQDMQIEGKEPGALKKEDEEPVAVTSVQDRDDTEEAERMLRDYFQLNVNFADLCMSWGAADPHFKRIADTFKDSTVEERLRGLGFGYRARFLQQSSKQILDTHGLQWLDGLRSVSYLQAREALCTLPGVGNKVADCACLMSLDKAEAVPIDTHMWQIAKRDYNFTDNKKQKTITDQLYREIGDFFRNLWGPYAGWAQAVLFCADLKRFQKLKEMPNLKQPKKEEDNVEDESSM